MLQLEMPHINVLSKIDLIAEFGDLRALSRSCSPLSRAAFNLDFYTEVQDLSYLSHLLDTGSKRSAKFAEMNKAICDLIEDFALVSFETLCVEVRRRCFTYRSERGRTSSRWPRSSKRWTQQSATCLRRPSTAIGPRARSSTPRCSSARSIRARPPIARGKCRNATSTIDKRTASTSARAGDARATWCAPQHAFALMLQAIARANAESLAAAKAQLEGV